MLSMTSKTRLAVFTARAGACRSSRPEETVAPPPATQSVPLGFGG